MSRKGLQTFLVLNFQMLFMHILKHFMWKLSRLFHRNQQSNYCVRYFPEVLLTCFFLLLLQISTAGLKGGSAGMKKKRIWNNHNLILLLVNLMLQRISPSFRSMFKFSLILPVTCKKQLRYQFPKKSIEKSLKKTDWKRMFCEKQHL